MNNLVELKFYKIVEVEDLFKFVLRSFSATGDQVANS